MFVALPIVPHDGTATFNEASAQALKLEPMTSRGFSHAQAQLLDRVHGIWAVSGQVVGASGNTPVIRRLLGAQLYLIFLLLAPGIILPKSCNTIGPLQLEGLYE